VKAAGRGSRAKASAASQPPDAKRAPPRGVKRLRTASRSQRPVEERLARLASFPEENPNPVIEMDFEGRTTYLNPVAQESFPDLRELGGSHPLMRGIAFPFVPTDKQERSQIVREIRVGDQVYDQKICHMEATKGRHLRIYIHDITRRKRAEETNRMLIRRLVNAHEEERQRVSRELHDEAGQALTALKLSLELILGEVPERASSARANLAEAIQLTESTKEQIRILAHGLRPPALDAVGLNLTLESFCRDFSKRTQLPIDYRGASVTELSDIANMCLYRTLQEALANVVRHAGATRVEVRLTREAGEVHLVVEDNGKGPGPKPASRPKRKTGIGLIGMQERLALLGGALEIGKGRRGGLRLSARLPLQEPA